MQDTTAPAPASNSKTTVTSKAKPKAARTSRGTKPHVPSACTNCKKAHLACDLQRPCRRCVNAGKCDTCKDVQHKKRGRPRTKDRKIPVTGSQKSLMETQMFQFSFASPAASAAAAAAAAAAATSVSAAVSPTLTSTATIAQPSLPASPIIPADAASTIGSTTDTAVASFHSSDMSELKLSNILRLPQNQKSDKSNVPTEAPLPTIAEEGSVSNTPTSTSYLFLTPSLLCLRLEEPACSSNSSKGSRTALLGHSLLSLINRSLLDFVSECDRPQVQAMLDAMKHKLSTRLVRTTSRVYSHAILGQPPRAVDPNTFQAFSVDRLLQRVCADISGNVRAHLRTASGGYDLFDMHIYVGAVSSSAGPFDRHAESPSVATSGLAQDEVYFVCRITKFDALNCASVLSSPVLPRIFMPSSSPESCERPAKRPCIATNSSDALYMLASVTENDASTGKCSTKQSVYSSQSTVTSSPLLATPSPSLSSSPRIATTLPSISDLLKSIDETEKSRFSRPSPPHSQFMSPFSNKF